MAWRLHDIIDVGYFNMTVSNDNQITKNIKTLSRSHDFSDFSKDYFDAFRDIIMSIPGNTDSDISWEGIRLVPFSKLKELSDIPHEDTSGMSEHFKNLYKAVKDDLTPENENLHLITLQFID